VITVPNTKFKAAFIVKVYEQSLSALLDWVYTRCWRALPALC